MFACLRERKGEERAREGFLPTKEEKNRALTKS